MKGKDIRRIRGKGMSQIQFCQAIKLENGRTPTPSMLSKWENDVHAPDERWMESIMKYKAKKEAENV